MLEYSVIIPVYNAEKSLEELHERLVKFFNGKKLTYEIILVDDRGTDNSWKIMKELAAKNKNVKAIRLSKNYGQHGALMCGLNHTTGERVVTMDDDLQHPPEEIEKLIKAMDETDADIVMGKAKQKKHSFMKNIGSAILNWLYKIILHKPKNVKVGTFCIIKKNVVKGMIENKTPTPLLNALMLSNTTNVINTEFNHEERKYGNSKYSFLKHLDVFYSLVINYSTIPLRIVTLLGLLSSIIGIVYVLANSFLAKAGVPGWASTTISIFLFGGMTLFSLGIIGEYISRILQEVSHREQYRIDKIITHENKCFEGTKQTFC
ncbi:glycosyltransferase family 2 protein [archaeon]|nr:glycosyltransferase family 2 protein [archaeon]